MKKKYYVYKMNQSDEECSDSQSLLDKKEKDKQTCTDLFGIFGFVLFLLIWLSITYRGLISSYSNELRLFSSSSYNSNDLIPLLSSYALKDFLHEYSNLYVWFILPSVLYLWLYFMAVRFLTKFTIVITILLTTTFWIIAFYYFTSTDQTSQIVRVVFLSLILIVFIVNAYVFNTLMELKIDDVIKVIQDACKAMMGTPSFLVIAILQMGSIITILSVTYTVINNLYFEAIDPRSNLSYLLDFDQVRYVEYICGLLLIYVLFSVWLLIFIYNFGQMILYKTFTTWYRTENKNSVPYGISLICAANHIRYHIGTIAYGSTFFTIFPIVIAICNTPKNNIPRRSAFTTLICLPFVLCNATVNTFVACAAHGANFYRSAKHSFKIIWQNPLMFAVTRLVTFWMLLFGQIIIPALTMTAPVIMSYFGLSCPDDFYYFYSVIPICYIVIGTVSFIAVAIFLNGLKAAITSVLFCSLEDLDRSESGARITKHRRSSTVEDAANNGFIE